MKGPSPCLRFNEGYAFISAPRFLAERPLGSACHLSPAILVLSDVGGTKTDLAIFSKEAGAHTPLVQAKVYSAENPNLQALVKEFLTKMKMPVDRACFEVTGPVIDGRVKTTNLPWVIDEASLAKELNLRSVQLINDLEAVARAIPILQASDVCTLNVGEPVPKGAIGIIAPGTGLGESFLAWDGSYYVAHSSEGGHADFAQTDERQIRLLQFLLKRFDQVSIERVCSGIGLPNIYEFLRDIEHIPERELTFWWPEQQGALQFRGCAKEISWEG